LNEAHQPLDYADDFKLFGANIYTIDKIIKYLLVGSKKIGPEANVEDTKHMFMSRKQ
jgi:hypothetical protein